MKINFAALHLTDTSELNVIVSEGRSMISYKLESNESDFEVIVIHKNGLNEETTYDLTGYTIYLDTLGLLKDTDVLGIETINPFQTIVAVKAK